tara:strand:- start:1672 stop:2640 length:969 start_codon:yes stop_codon:yes gene_type:complete
MSKPFKMKDSPFLRNFGVGPGLSPYKEDEGEGEDEGKSRFKKTAGLAAEMFAGGLEAVYGKVGGKDKDKKKEEKEKEEKNEEEKEATNPITSLIRKIFKLPSPNKMLSPLKARQSSRGGKRAGKATKTKGRRGGFAESTGKRGAGGRNVGGYNVQTRFARRATEPTGGSTKLTSSGGSSKPYSYNKQGGITINNYGGGTGTQSQTQSQTQGQEWIPPVYGYREKTTHVGSWDYKSKGLPSYRQAWSLNLENIVNKYNNFEDYVQDLEDQKSGKKKGPKNYKKPDYKKGGTTKTEREKYIITEGYWKTNGGTSSQTQTQTQTR